ncbi:hypothetical protein PHYC_01525 [Phycisphaerales bacterium]|nr:hypothetical protein PHYC_01525 [Phycisphaerales bacterium]
MKDWLEALKASAALDDRRDRGPAPRGQARVDEALSHPGAASWTPAPTHLRSRIMDRVGRAEPERAALRRTGPMRSAALAFAAMVVMGLGVGVYLAWPRTPAATPDSRGSAAKAPELSTGALVQMPAEAGPIAMAAMENPLVEEARLIREDTRRAVERVFARLPMRMSR